ncbi:hypothetical protein PMAYCL1PPCAC_08620, partial [Pristionchus mayeri]
FKCNDCGRKFSQSAALSKHKRTHLDDEDVRLPHKCLQCGKRFHQHGALTRHENTHLDEDKRCPFKCKHCGKTLTQLQNLELHENKHLDDNDPRKKKFDCAICENVYTDRSALLNHTK